VKNTKNSPLKIWMRNHPVISNLICGLALVAMTALFVGAVMHTTKLPMVSVSTRTGEIVRVQDSTGKDVPAEKWDMVISRGYDQAWVP
jgi:hypothetical protein